MELWIGLGIIGLVILSGILTYNSLVSLRVRSGEAWADIQTQLKRRHDLIPNLVETVKGYMGHERGVLEKVTELRGAAMGASGPAAAAQAEGQLTQALRSLFAVAENYPQLKSNENVRMLQEELAGTENKISFARQFYNDIATSFNIAQQVFPGNMVASMFAFKPAELFEITVAAEREVPAVDLSLKK